jgi:hypothetical protein
MWNYGAVVVEAKVHEQTVPRSGAAIPPRTKSPAGSLSLRVTPDQFFIAMCRARVLRHPYFDESAEYAAISLGQRRHFTEVCSGLRLTSSAYQYVDFEDKAFRGRFGNTIGLLVAEALGYRWFAHFKQVQYGFSRPYPTEQTPDFLAMSSTSLAALECKGSATSSRPDRLWSSMRDAYAQQVDPWVAHPYGSAYGNAGIVVGARANQADAAYVDIIEASTSVLLPRAPALLSYPGPLFNYGVWLRLMGLTNVADAILRGKGQASPDERFFRISYGGLPYVGIERRVPPSYQTWLGDASVLWSLPGPTRPLLITLPEPVMAVVLASAEGQRPVSQDWVQVQEDRSRAYLGRFELRAGPEDVASTGEHDGESFTHPDGTLVVSGAALPGLELQPVEWFQGSFRPE